MRVLYCITLTCLWNLIIKCVSVYVCQKIIFSDSHPYTEEQIYVYVCLIRKEYKDDSHNKLNYLHVTWSFTVHFIWFSIGKLSHTFIHFQSNFLEKKSMDVCLNSAYQMYSRAAISISSISCLLLGFSNIYSHTIYGWMSNFCVFVCLCLPSISAPKFIFISILFFVDLLFALCFNIK